MILFNNATAELRPLLTHLYSRVPQSELLVIAGAGHFTYWTSYYPLTTSIKALKIHLGIPVICQHVIA